MAQDSQRVNIPGVGVVEFPASMSDAEVSAAAAKVYREQGRPTQGSGSGIGLSLIPAAANVAERAATNPTLPATIASFGRGVGGLAPIAAGGAKLFNGDPMGAAESVIMAGPGAWGGGKAGWFTGKMLQRTAGPAANALNKVAPIAKGLSGVQGALDLAQMQDPKRTDIGFLGVGHSPQQELGMNDDQYAQYNREHPPIINAIIQRLLGK